MGRISTRKHKEKDMDETDILKERKERILAYMESEGYVPISAEICARCFLCRRRTEKN